MAGRWQRRPEGANWGDFGDNDQCGRLNLITPDKVRQGIAEVIEGKTFCVSLPLDYPGGNVLNPRRHPPVLASTVRSGKPNYLYPFGDEDPAHTDVVCDDVVQLTLQYSTQFDSLCHVGSMFDADGDGTPEPVFYNGWRGGEHIVGPQTNGSTGDDVNVHGVHADRLGIENMAEKTVQGRAVMIDLRHHVGDGRVYVGYEQLMRIMEADKVEVEPGDMVCLYTGFADEILAMNKNPDPERVHDLCAVLDGRDEKVLRWVDESGLSILMADNYAVEGFPASKPGDGRHAALPLHELCLFKLGIHLGELFYFGELAPWLRANGRNRFLMTAMPLRLPGAVGSPVAPVATV